MKTEKQMIEELKEHLQIAESWNWNHEKMLFIDGYLKAINQVFGKDYGFSCTDIYVTENHERVLVK